MLEIGSGTGQHAVYFASEFTNLQWQTSDLLENHQAINAWIDDSEWDWNSIEVSAERSIGSVDSEENVEGGGELGSGIFF